jgi:hypothetical protein
MLLPPLRCSPSYTHQSRRFCGRASRGAGRIAPSPRPHGRDRGRPCTWVVISGFGHGENAWVPGVRPCAFMGPQSPEPLQGVVISPDRPPTRRYSHFATVHPAPALPLMDRGNRHVHDPGKIGQPVCMRGQHDPVFHCARSRPVEASGTQQARHHTPCKPLGTLRGPKAVALERGGDRPKTHPGLAQGGQPGHQRRGR